MPTILDPIKTKKSLLWFSFSVCLGLALVVGTTLFMEVGPIGFLPAVVCLIPWLMHLAFLRPKLDLLSETSSQNFGGMTILVLAGVATINFALIFSGLSLKAIETFQIRISGDGVVLFALMLLMGSMFLFFYVLTWGIDNLNSIPYYIALQKSMGIIALPTIFIMFIVLMQPDFARFAFNRGLDHEFEFFYALVLLWCGLLLMWAVVPGLYLTLMAKTYKEYQRLAAESETEPLEFKASGEGLPDWYLPKTVTATDTN